MRKMIENCQNIKKMWHPTAHYEFNLKAQDGEYVERLEVDAGER